MRILALEASSTSAKAAIYDCASKSLDVVTHRLQLDSPDCHDADAAIAQVLNLGRQHLAGRPVDLITLCSTWHGLTLQSPDGASLTPVFPWSYSGAQDVETRLRTDAALPRWYYEHTGCPVSGSFPALKLVALAEAGIDPTSGIVMDEGSTLFERLTSTYATTASLASGTGLLNVHTLEWDADVPTALGLPALRLPEIVPPHTTAPLTTTAAAALGLPAGTPVLAPGPDGALSQLAAPGAATLSMGTSGALRVAVPAPVLSDDGSTWCYRCPDSWLVGAATSGCGNELDRARSTLLGGADYAAIEPRLRPGPRDVPTFLPFHFGERTPGWHSRRPAGFVGLAPRHDAIDRYQAVLQGVVFNLRQGWDELVHLLGRPAHVRASGGVLASSFWTQLTADVLGTDLELSSQQHASIVGAIRLGLSALGADDDAGPTDSAAGIVRPNPELANYYRERYGAYLDAYVRTPGSPNRQATAAG